MSPIPPFMTQPLSSHAPLFLSYLLFGLINISFDSCLRSNSDSTYYSLLSDYDINPTYDYISSTVAIQKSATSYILIYFIYLFCFGLPAIIVILTGNVIGKINHPIDLYVAWFGIGLIIIGAWLRWYAMRINKFFTRILRIGESQFIVTEGPYKYVRHPGYLGQLLIWNGFGLSSGNYFVALIIFIIIAFTYLYRIRKEEVILLRTFGVDYLEYSTRVSRLIPYIY